MTSDAHLWVFETEAALRSFGAAALLATLSEEERSRQGRFVFERDRNDYLVAHALLRMVLSLHTPTAARDLAFERNEYGRPELRADHDPRLRFSLSHSRGVSAVALVADADIGVDIEAIERGQDDLALAALTCGPAERATLAELRPRARAPHFVALWTLKEAYVKARGLGLSLPVAEISFAPAGDGTAAVTFGAAVTDDPGQWQFSWGWWPPSASPPPFCLSVAIRRAETVRWRRWTLDDLLSQQRP